MYFLNYFNLLSGVDKIIQYAPEGKYGSQIDFQKTVDRHIRMDCTFLRSLSTSVF